MYLKNYKIDEEGIYHSENDRYNEVSYYYEVRFNQSDTKSQLDKFLKYVKSIGANERSREIGQLLGVTK